MRLILAALLLLWVLFGALMLSHAAPAMAGSEWCDVTMRPRPPLIEAPRGKYDFHHKRSSDGGVA